MPHHRLHGAFDIGLRALSAQFFCLVERHTCGNIAVQRVMCRSLVRHHIWDDAAPHQLGVDLGGVTDQADRERLSLDLYAGTLLFWYNVTPDKVRSRLLLPILQR